jgi:putative NADH-flavin reductase
MPIKLALLGATGNLGTEIRKEALARGHQVTAIVRSQSRLAAQANLSVVAGDAYDETGLVGVLRGHDAFISAFSPDRAEPIEDKPNRLRQSHRAIIGAAKRSGVKRFILVGGVGSLWYAPGVLVVDAPEYGHANRGPTLANKEILEWLKTEDHGLDWTYISPPRIIEAGERTGHFRLGLDDLVRDDKGLSRISRADFAIAAVDELENPAHLRKRFTIAY